MLKFLSFILISIFSCIIYGVASNEKILVCYYGTWATYRNGNGNFEVNNIDPFLCTHLVYSFFGITEEGEFRVIDPYLDLEENWGRGNIKKFNQLKLINPKLKTMAAVGGWNEGSKKFSVVAQNQLKREKFVKMAFDFVTYHGFDGIDLDWEYPGQRDGDPLFDKQSYTLLLKDLKELFATKNLLVSAAVASAEFSATISYDIPEIAKYLDFISVMAYDMHGSWDSEIGINAPMYSGPNDVTSLQKQLNVNSSVYYWLEQGAPREKLVIGMPTYGRSFTLANANRTTPGSAHNGPGQGGQYAYEAGMLGYNEFCERQNQWTTVWENTQKVPYAFQGNQWVGYDNVESLQIKSNFINSLGLAGAMVWSIETDDFRGICGSEKYPLIKTIRNIVVGDVEIPTSTLSTTTTDITDSTTNSDLTTSTTTETPSEFQCPSGNGYYRDPILCARFYYCLNGVKYTFTCPEGTYFNEKTSGCDWSYLVQCP